MMDNQLTTSCKDCVFANYIGKTQTDCKLGRIAKFRQNKVDIIDAEDLEENEFFVVESWCNYYRDENWVKSLDSNIEDLSSQVKKEAIFPVGFIVLFNESDDIEQLGTTISAIKEIESVPYVIVANSSNLDDIDVITKVQEFFEGSEIDYKITKILDSSFDNGQIIDAAFPNITNSYYYLLESGNEPVKDVESLIDKQINTELQPVVYIKGDNGISGTVIQSTMHKFLNGNYGMSLLEKIEGIQGEDGSVKSVVWTWEEVRNGKS